MTGLFASKASKELVFRYVMENIDYRKRCIYLQEIIKLGQKDSVWQKALLTFFDNSFNSTYFTSFSKN